jgi:hypothetical protein
VNARLPNLPLGRGWLGPVVVLLALPGCQAFYAYRPIPVLTIDAETKQPIPAAEVHITYPMSKPPYSPTESLGPTERDGIARLQAAPYGEGGITIEATAKDYLSGQTFLTTENVQAIDRAHFFEDVLKRPPAVTVALYKGPQPSVEFIVPASYRGRIKATMQIRPDAACPPGQRCFAYAVPDSGEVAVSGPMLLQRVQPCDFHAKSGDSPLPERPNDLATVGFWWLKSDRNFHIFCVGTQSEYDAERRAVQWEDRIENRPASSGKGGGQGKHGRKSGGDPTASTGP